MDRQIIYPGAIPLETDLLNTNKYAMMGLAKLSAAMMGSTTYLHGLACTPSSPASMVVNVAKGQIYSIQNVDNSAYSSLAADTSNTILKQGVILSSTQFTLTAPITAGQSINYLIQVTYSDTDSGATTLPYYNAANPSVAYSGPNNSGAAQNTVRSGVCTVALKAGVAATTGTQTTPPADTGYTAAWVITVAQGANALTTSNIAVAQNAPFLPAAGIVSAIQQCTMTYAADTGSANAYVAQFVPSIPTLIDGTRLTFKAKTANTGASTFAVNGGNNYPLYSHANQALQGGEIISNGLIEVEWNSTLTAWVLCGNSGGALPVAPATQSNHAMQLGQAIGRLINVQVITTSGNYVKTPGTTKAKAFALGGGGAGGGCAITGASQSSAGKGGNGGAFGWTTLLDMTSVSSVACTVGSAGIGALGADGSSGGNTSFGAYITAPGGSGGTNGAVASALTVTSSNDPGSECSGSAVEISVRASRGTGKVVLGTGSGQAYSGAGGSSPYGNGGGSVTNGLGGQPGYGYGAGGGSVVNPASQATAQSGGNGSGGLIIVWEYA